MAQQGPNPIELYEGAVQQILPIFRGVKADQLAAATPCAEWNVQNLINHNLKVAQFVFDVIAETGAADPFRHGRGERCIARRGGGGRL